MAEPTRQELEQALIKVLDKEHIIIERQDDKSYTATWMSTRGQDSITGSSLPRVIGAAIRAQKANEYWRGQRELELEIIKELRTISPLPIAISRPKAGGWRWEWGYGFGLGPDFARVLKYALDYAMRTLHTIPPDMLPREHSSAIEAAYQGDGMQETGTGEDCING
jgi:hypothetical protein